MTDWSIEEITKFRDTYLTEFQTNQNWKKIFKEKIDNSKNESKNDKEKNDDDNELYNIVLLFFPHPDLLKIGLRPVLISKSHVREYYKDLAPIVDNENILDPKKDQFLIIFMVNNATQEDGESRGYRYDCIL